MLLNRPPDGASAGRIMLHRRTASKTDSDHPVPSIPGTACIIIPEPFLSGSALMELFNVKPAENSVAELLVRGMTPDECALHLGVSITTVRTHLSALYRKHILVINPSYCSLSGLFIADLFCSLIHLNECGCHDHHYTEPYLRGRVSV